MRDILFRGKTANPNGLKNHTSYFVYGLLENSGDKEYPYIIDGCFVIPETVGQLRYENKNERYFDGDVYYHAGYGLETVSDLCELQYALLVGNADDIGEVIGNIHDNPELLNK